MSRRNAKSAGVRTSSALQKSCLADTNHITSAPQAAATMPEGAQFSPIRGAYFPGDGACWRRADVARITAPGLLRLVPNGQSRRITVPGEPRKVTYLSGPATVALMAAHDDGASMADDLLDSVREWCGTEAMFALACHAGDQLRAMERAELGIGEEVRVAVVDLDRPGMAEAVTQMMGRYDRGAEHLGRRADEALAELESEAAR